MRSGSRPGLVRKNFAASPLTSDGLMSDTGDGQSGVGAPRAAALDLRRLLTFREVARCGSFSAAGTHLGYTQSAISQQIAGLEQSVGAQLLDRGGRRTSLTPAGVALVAHAETITRQVAAAMADIEVIVGQRRCSLRIAGFPSAAATVMPQAIARFRDRHPGTQISMTIADASEALSYLRAGDVDVAVVNNPRSRPGQELVRTRHLFNDPMHVALPAGHRLADRPTVRLGDLAGECWLLATTAHCPDWDVFLEACRDAGFDPHIGLRNDDYLALQGSAAVGGGVALIPQLATSIVRDDVVIRPLSPNGPVRHIAAATLTNASHGPATSAMLSILSEIGRARDGGSDGAAASQAPNHEASPSTC